MSPTSFIHAAGTASEMVGSVLCTAEGRISSASTKLDTIDKRHQNFLKKALPYLIKTHPRESICTDSNKTTRVLNRYGPPDSCIQIPDLSIIVSRLAMRRDELVGTVENKPFWQRLSPFFKSAEIGELELRLVEYDDTTLVCLLNTP